MKVGMYYSNRDVRVEEMAVPKLGRQDILVRVKASGICGSDVMEWYRIKRAPLVLGHEVSGDVVEVGSGITAFTPGDRVFTIHHVPCEACPSCLKGHHTACAAFQKINNFEPGGFSEYLKVSGRSIDTGTLKLPPDVTYEEGTFIEPLGTVLRGLRTAGITPGSSLVVIGSGLSGLLFVKAARALGAGNVIAVDIHASRLEAARNFGASHVIDATEDIPAAVMAVNEGVLADIVVLCTGAMTAVGQALKSVGPGGTVLFFAVPEPDETVEVDLNSYWRNDISLKTSYGSAPIDHMQALTMIRAGNINVKDMVTHRFPLRDIARGFKLVAEGKDCLKVIIES